MQDLDDPGWHRRSQGGVDGRRRGLRGGGGAGEDVSWNATALFSRHRSGSPATAVAEASTHVRPWMMSKKLLAIWTSTKF